MVKILFLHGYAQTPEEIASKSQQIRRALPDIEFVFPPAATELISYDGDHDDRSRAARPTTPRYSWNRAEEDMSTNLINMEATLTHLIPILEQQGPFDGIMGFSQGAAVASAITAILEQKHIAIAHPEFKFAILFCGARPSSSAFDGIFRDIKTPSLHLIGRQDVMVPLHRSLELADAFDGASVLHHPGTHFIPQGRPYTRAIADFVLVMLNAEAEVSPGREIFLPPKILSKDVASRSGSLSSRGSPGSRVRIVRKSSFVRVRSIRC